MSQKVVNSSSHLISCFLCKENFLPLDDSSEEAKDKKSILHDATSIISKRFNLTFPLPFQQTSSEDDGTCDDCHQILKELMQLQNVLEKTEQRILQVFNLINEKIGATNKLSFGKSVLIIVKMTSLIFLDDEPTSLILPMTSMYDNDLIEIKSEPPSFSDQDDFDCCQEEPSEVPLQSGRRTRKRKIHFDEIVPGKIVLTHEASTSKRTRKKKVVDVGSEEIEVSIKNKKKKKKWYTIRLETPSPPKSSTRQATSIANQLPRVVLQDFVGLIPQDIYTERLSPLDQCQFKLGKIGRSEKNPKQETEVTTADKVLSIIEPQSKTSRKRRSKKSKKVVNEPDLSEKECRDSDYELENDKADEDEDNFTEGDNELDSDKDETKPKKYFISILKNFCTF
jgi:hypothetical protein